MINQIDPHGPVQQDPSGVPVSTRDQRDGKPFDDFLSDQPASGKPSPIKDHSPPPTSDPGLGPDDPRVPDPIKGIMPSPIRWKEAKHPAPKTPPETVVTPGTPLPTPVDPQLAAIAITLSPSLLPPTPPIPMQDEPTTGVGSAQGALVALASSSVAPGTPADSTTNTLPVTTSAMGMLRRIQSDVQAVAAGAVATVSPGSAPGDASQSISTDAPNLKPIRLTPPPGAIPVEQNPPAGTATDPQAASESAGSGVADTSEVVPLPPGAEISVTTLTNSTMLSPGPVSLPAPSNLNLPGSPLPILPEAIDADTALPSPVSPAVSATPASADARVTDPAVPVPLPAHLDLAAMISMPDSRLVKADQAMPSPTGSEVAVVAPVTDSRVPAPVVLPTPVEQPPPSATVVPPTAVTLSSSNVQGDSSASPAGARAKIAGSPASEFKSARKPEMGKSQVPASEQIKLDSRSDGTPVAKDEATLNAAFPDTEKDADTSPLPKRGDVASSDVFGSSRTGNNHPHDGGVLMTAAVSGPTTVNSSATLITATPTADPTAARQAVKVETLLQQTLSAGESVRPNGSDQMEMRVRLDGGQEDVTVRMQVVNDRLQVTFQTNSPELRKALEHGWEQLSTTASGASTLAMSAPRFEPSRVNPDPQMGQASSQSFASNQENARRQPSETTSADEFVPSAASQRGGFTTAQVSVPASGQSGARRWSGWA